MKEYIVLKKVGVRTPAGELIKEGKTFLGSPRSATIQLLLRCKEIKAVEFSEGGEGQGSDDKKELKTIADYTKALNELEVQIPNGSKLDDLIKLHTKAVESSGGGE